ncbi:hypothetical protein [Streptomyces sp. NPDC058620]|uniref:hypothetical protein n=1 Tax=Streptomyces sp. NPDC058620 TaxID=3346560 RepID=UPI00365E116D
MKHWIGFWTALWAGSSRLNHRTVDWLCAVKHAPKTPEVTAGEQPTEGSALLRWVGLLLAAAVAKGLPWTTAIATTCTAAWALTALALGYAASLTDEDDQEPEQLAAEGGDPEQPTEEPPHPSELLELGSLAQLLAHADTGEGSGVHLLTLRTRWSGSPVGGLPPAAWETRDVRALMARHGVRVRDGVRVPPKGGREGVHRDDFPPLPPPPLGPGVVGVVVAGQSNNNNAANTPTYVITDDPDNPVRHNVLHTERT